MSPEPLRQGQELSDTTFEAIASIAHEVAGLHLPSTKKALVASRIARRLQRLALPSFEEYLDLIATCGAPERRRLVTALTTNVSNFFRERHHFQALRDHILPPLLERARKGERVRIWSAGCANGQEAYSIALTLLEMDQGVGDLDVRILGTDIDPMVVRTAQLGAYHISMMNDVAPDALDLHFRYDGSSSTFKAEASLRALVLFRELNLHGAWPMPGRFDIIFCRNVVIYFDEAGRNALWRRFSKKLNDGGWLFIGHSERVPDGVAPELEMYAHTAYRLSSSG